MVATQVYDGLDGMNDRPLRKVAWELKVHIDITTIVGTSGQVVGPFPSRYTKKIMYREHSTY